MVGTLSRKRNRDQHHRFIVEGYKSIKDLIDKGLRPEHIFVTAVSTALNAYGPSVVAAREMNAMSQLKTPPGYLAVFQKFEAQPLPTNGLILVLDRVRDPGNLGTIVRLASWFNIPHIVCSLDTVDLYNPKCVQASMASIAAVHVHYTALGSYLKSLHIPVYATAMQGKSLYSEQLPGDAAVIMGSESRGISDPLLQLGKPLTIPSYGHDHATESLNVAMAASIVLSEWRRVTGR